MAWFRVDDKFHQHPKVLQIPRPVRALAIGTWTLAGVWSANNEKDGYIPSYVLDEIAGSLEAASELVAVKLWKTKGQGFQFVNWKEFQPTREQNEARRESERVRKAKYRSGSDPRKDGGESGSVPPGQTRVPNTPSRPVPDPTRPDHERLTSSVSQGDDEVSTGGQSVDNSRVSEHLLAMTGRQPTEPQVWAVIGLMLERNPAPKRPTAYVLAAITRDPIGWQNYLDTGTEPA